MALKYSFSLDLYRKRFYIFCIYIVVFSKLTLNILFLVQIHKNPLFFRETTDTKLLPKPLPKDEWSQLYSGNTISLLPDELIFTIRIDGGQNDKEEDQM